MEAVLRSLRGDARGPIGLGCSRLGSLNGAGPEEARALVALALDLGVRVFDTAGIYGQGDSERALGAALAGREDCVVCSKAGRAVPWAGRVLAPVKGALRGLAWRTGPVRRGVAALRRAPVPTRWDAAFLTRSLDASLRRLGRERIEVFLLHSPPVEVLTSGAALDALERARAAGKAGLVGASVDDAATGHAALDDARVRVLQLPLWSAAGDAAIDGVLRRAAAAGVIVLGRDVLGGVDAAARARPGFAQGRIAAAIRRPGVSLPLIGTTSPRHLELAVRAARVTLTGEQTFEEARPRE